MKARKPAGAAPPAERSGAEVTRRLKNGESRGTSPSEPLLREPKGRESGGVPQIHSSSSGGGAGIRDQLPHQPVSRRQFLKGGGAAIGLAALGVIPVPARPRGRGKGAGQKGILIDTTRCVGCNMCVEACKRKNHQPPVQETWPKDLDENSFTYIRDVREDTYHAKRQCMHCVDPACVSVCPVAALRKSELGPVHYDVSRCIGCRYCQLACPFQVPRYTWESTNPRITKCNMCRDRVEGGLKPACVAACPFGALKFGDREAMLQEAHNRIEKDPKKYLQHVYGEHELGGTDVLYLSAVPFKELGLKDMPEEAPPEHTWEDTVKLPWVMVLGALFLTTSWFITGRQAHEQSEPGEPGEGEPS